MSEAHGSRALLSWRMAAAGRGCREEGGGGPRGGLQAYHIRRLLRSTRVRGSFQDVCFV